MKRLWKRSRFSLGEDSPKEPSYPGYSKGQYSGFGSAYPAFTYQTYRRILRDLRKGIGRDFSWTFNPKTDTFQTVNKTMDDENGNPLTEYFKGFDIKVEGKNIHVYRLDGWDWVRRDD